MHSGFSMTHLTNDIVLLRLAIAVKLKPFAYRNWGHIFYSPKNLVKWLAMESGMTLTAQYTSKYLTVHFLVQV